MLLDLLCIFAVFLFLHTYSCDDARFIKVPAKSCRMHILGNSTASVTNLNLEIHPVKIGGTDLVQPLTAVTLGEEENTIWKMILPPTRDQIC